MTKSGNNSNLEGAFSELVEYFYYSRKNLTNNFILNRIAYGQLRGGKNMDEFSAPTKYHLKIITILAVAAMLTISIIEYKTKKVNICIDDSKITVKTLESTVGELLEKEGIKLIKGGYISHKSADVLKDNTTIVIKTPKIYNIKMADKVVQLESTENTVENILKDLEIKLGENDYTYPSLKGKINPMDYIEIVKVKETVDIVKEEIPFEDISRKSNKLTKGTTQIVQNGKNGLKEIEVKKIFKNGKLNSEKIIAEKIVSKPVSNIVEVGTKDVHIASRGNFRFKKSFIATATAYDLSYASCGKRPGDRGYGITASGAKAGPGSVSVDPRVIPLGTKLYIESLDGSKDYGFATATDTGGAIKGNKIDLFFSSGEACKIFGRRKVKVYILEN